MARLLQMRLPLCEGKNVYLSTGGVQSSILELYPAGQNL